MLTRRTVLKQGGYAALATAVPLFVRPARAQTTAAAFDYYISPSGSNSNPGTLAAPWAITALASKGSTYAGKRIGLLPGNYPFYSIVQASGQGPGSDYAAIGITGGTSGSPTYLASCNSSGAYTPRVAILDGHQTICNVSAISLGATTTITVNSTASSNPFTSGSVVALNGVQGTTQINGLYLTVGSLGGSSGAWTFTVNNGVGGAALNSSGFSAYTGSGWAGHGYPSSECAFIGQIPNTGTALGNLVLDGIVFTGGYEYCIELYGTNTGSEGGGATGNAVQNCEIWDISGFINDNCCGIRMWYQTGALVHNCKIHQILPNLSLSGTSGNDCFGINTFHCYSNIYEYNTIYNTYNGICDKNGQNGNHTYRYNYIEQTSAVGPNQGSGILCVGGSNSTDTRTAHHNIILAVQPWEASTAGGPYPESMNVYNNTCYWTAGGFNNGGFWFPVASPGKVTSYNNILACNGTPNYQGFVQYTTGQIALSDYNAYSSSGSSFVLGPVGGAYVGTASTLSAWQGLGYDSHAVVGSPTFSNPTALNPTGYQLNVGSVGQGTGRVGGVSSGAACDMGAWGYDPALGSSPTQIGCNFVSSAVSAPPAAVPLAPVLTIG